MKRIFTFLATMFIALNMFAQGTTPSKLYLRGGWWDGNARYAAYFFEGAREQWVKMNSIGLEIYECETPQDYTYTNVIFVRMNGSTANLDWSEKWDQTVDLQLAADKNYYVVSDPTEGDQCKGSWSEFRGFTLAGSSVELFGTEWDPLNMDNVMTGKDGIYTWTKKSVKLAAGDIECKVTDGSWGMSYGFTYTDNAKFTIPADGVYNVTFTFDANLWVLSAKFATPIKVTATVNDPLAGTVTGAGDYDQGDNVALEATANEGYEFDYWTVNGERWPDTYSAIYIEDVQNDIEVVAHFRKIKYDVNVIWTSEYGDVKGVGTYEHGETVTLTAVPNEGFQFDGWSDGYTEPVYSFVITSDVNLEANFSYKVCKLTVLVEGSGDVDITEGYYGGQDCAYGQMIDLVANPADHYVFVNWTVDGKEVYAEPMYNFYIYDDLTITAHFAVEKHTISATVEHGTVTGDGEYEYGSTATLIATPNEGYHFVDWTESGLYVSDKATYQFSVERDMDFTGTCEINKYDIEVEVYEPGTGEVFGGGLDIEHGTEVSIDAVPATGHRFVYWKNFAKDLVVSEQPNYTFRATDDATLTAIFVPLTYRVAAQAEHGDVDGTGEYEYGETATLTATPHTGYEFVRWEIDGAEVSTNPVYSFTVEDHVMLTAIFQALKFDINLYAAAEDGTATINGATSGTFEYGTTVTAIATPATGREFVNWTVGSEEVSKDARYTFTVTESIDLEAHFQLQSFPVIVTADQGGTVKVEGAAEGNLFTYGSEATITAEADEDHKFIGWLVDGADYGTDPSIRLEVTAPIKVHAKFASTIVTVTARPNDEKMGTVSGDGDYHEGDKVTLTATAFDGYKFVRWAEMTGAPVSTDAEYTFTVTKDITLIAEFEILKGQVNISVDGGKGEVTGAESGLYPYGTTITLTATPAEGHSLYAWRVDGVELPATPTYTFVVKDETIDIVAVFQLNEYTVTLKANDPAAGTVSGEGTYKHGETAIISASAGVDYEFVHWLVKDKVFSTDATYSFTVTEDVEATAVFESTVVMVKVTATTSDAKMGSVSGGGEFRQGATVTLTATPNPGYAFVHWVLPTGAPVSTDATYTFNALEDTHLTAVFEVKRGQVNISVEGKGTVTGATSGRYDMGTSITLTATPAEGHTFAGWRVDGTMIPTQAPYTFVVKDDVVNIVAVFLINKYTVRATANNVDWGKVTGAGTYEHGATATLEAIAATDYAFVHWLNKGKEVSTNPTYSFTVTENVELTAVFKSTVVIYDITVKANDPLLGTVTGGGQYREGADVTITATPAKDCKFIHWIDRAGHVVSSQDIYTFKAIESIDLTAVFEGKQGQVNISVSGGKGEVTGAESGLYAYGTKITLKATPAEGNSFKAWRVNGVETATSTVYTFTVDRDYIDITAIFQINQHTVTAVANNPDWGTVTGAGTYEYGAPVELVATPATDFKFLHWLVKDKVVSTSPTYNFNVTEDVAATAVFDSIIVMVKVTATANNPKFGTVTGSGEYRKGATVTLTATPAEGCTFRYWAAPTGAPVSADATYTFTATEDIQLVAEFEVKTYTVEAAANNPVWGTVTGAGTYEHGATATLVATPATDYSFLHWLVNDKVVSTDQTYSFTVTENVSATAVFEEKEVLVKVSAQPNDPTMGTVTGAGEYRKGATVTLTATPNEGYAFVRWAEMTGAPVSTDAVYTFTATADVTWIAEFEKLPDTALDNLTAEPAAKKVMKDGLIYIIKNDKIYTLYGQEVK